MNRTFQLHGSGASHPRASNALGRVRVVSLRYFSSPALNGSTPGVPGPKHMKVQTRTQLVFDGTRGPLLPGPKHPSKSLGAHLSIARLRAQTPGSRACRIMLQQCLQLLIYDTSLSTLPAGIVLTLDSSTLSSSLITQDDD